MNDSANATAVSPRRIWCATGGLILVMLGATFVAATFVGCGSSSPHEEPFRADRHTSTNTPAEISANEPDQPNHQDSANDDGAATERTRDAMIAKADALLSQRDYGAAAEAFKTWLLIDPTDLEILFRLAGVLADSGDLSEAVAILDGIPVDHPEAGLPALGQSADWCFQLQRYDEAERRYRAVLERVPQAAPALRQLAYLLNRQGRRHEAAQFIYELCKLGNVRQDELHSLIALGNAMYDPLPEGEDSSVGPIPPAGEYPYWPLGASGQARKLFSDEKFEEAAQLLRQSVADGSAPPAMVALYGLAVLESQNDEGFEWWLTQTNGRTRDFAEYWAALGGYLVNQHRFEEAARALAEAIDRDPTDLRSLSRLRQVFLVLDDDDAARVFFDRWTAVRETLRVNNRVAATSPPDLDAIGELASMLRELNRPLEAVLWQAVEAHYRGTSTSQQLALNQQREQLVAAGTLFPTRSQRWCDQALDQYPMPKLDSIDSSETGVARQFAQLTDSTPAKFENVAEAIGLHHRYLVASEPVGFRFAVYQMLGGGIVVFDYDQDGGSDFYFAQGGADPPAFRSNRSNQLFRNTDSSLADVTEIAAANEFQYSIGCTAGDWNQDGFPDLVVTNVGIDTLMINNGDGTFSRRPIGDKFQPNRVPSSVAMADLTGDHLPDIYQANYVDDPRMVLKPPIDESGKPLLPVLPSKYKSGADLFIENDGTCELTQRRFVDDVATDSTSLGLVITNFNKKPGNEVFVGNDMNPNQLWVRSSNGQWSDEAPLRGCAFSYTGAATASMGVASGDFDGSGTLDLHITNYQDERACLYLSRDGTFRDRTVRQGLARASSSVLGFGTQSIDYDNDGRLDLVVTNGHIEDAVENTGPFRQPPQLFANLGRRFKLAEVTDPSGYWDGTHVGRGLARVDFDRDGRQDFLITHIEQPSVLMLNRTPSDNHWLELRLVGTQTERDGIGAKLRLRVGERQFFGWIIAGDGYLCSNEATVAFGLGKATEVDQLEIDWPSGGHQVFQQVQADQRLLVVEDQDEPFAYLQP